MVSLLEKPASDGILITGLLAGGMQRRLFEMKLYDRFFYLIREGARKYALPEEECASAYSDTIISLIDNIVHHRYEGRASLKSYTYRIFMNKCVDLVRKKTTNRYEVNHTSVIDELTGSLPDKARGIVQQLIEKSNRSVLLQQLQAIGEKCKQLLLLFEDGYSDKEIATIMHYNTADVVKTSRLRCLEKLKEKMGVSNA